MARVGTGGTSADEVLAAGAVLWRGTGDSAEIALVHRPRYDDWSLPKGKLAPGEHPIVGALREVLEETGQSGEVGRFLCTLRYPHTRYGRQVLKKVDYWAMRAGGEASFSPNDEVDDLAWLPAMDALGKLSYPRDREPVERLLERPLETTTLLLVRHARAGDKASWRGDDRLRPLDPLGAKQAQLVSEICPAFGVRRVLSADRARCIDTVRPLAERLGVPVELDPSVGEDAYVDNPERTVRTVRDLARAGEHAAVCSQGGVLPDLIVRLAEGSGWDAAALGETAARKGSVWQLSFARGSDQLVDATYYARLDPPVPAPVPSG